MCMASSGGVDERPARQLTSAEPMYTILHFLHTSTCLRVIFAKKNGVEAVSRGTSFKKRPTSATSARSKNLKEVTQAEISRGGFRLVIPECAGFSHLPGRV